MNQNQFSISAKNLAGLAKPDYCPRCFWVQMRCNWQVPFSFFAGITMTLDAYTKKMVNGTLENLGKLPGWFDPVKVTVRQALELPKRGEFKLRNEEFNTVIGASVDAAFSIHSDSQRMQVLIVDYKTAKWTKAQQEIFPIYEAQLNIYAEAWEQNSPAHQVNNLALIYFQAQSDGYNYRNMTPFGFNLGFEAKVVLVDKKPGLVRNLIIKGREIFDSSRPPAGKDNCEDCDKIEAFLQLAQDPESVPVTYQSSAYSGNLNG